MQQFSLSLTTCFNLNANSKIRLKKKYVHILNSARSCINIVNFLDLPILKILLAEDLALFSFSHETKLALHIRGLNASVIARISASSSADFEHIWSENLCKDFNSSNHDGYDGDDDDDDDGGDETPESRHPAASGVFRGGVIAEEEEGSGRRQHMLETVCVCRLYRSPVNWPWLRPI